MSSEEALAILEGFADKCNPKDGDLFDLPELVVEARDILGFEKLSIILKSKGKYNG